MTNLELTVVNLLKRRSMRVAELPAYTGAALSDIERAIFSLQRMGERVVNVGTPIDASFFIPAHTESECLCCALGYTKEHRLLPRTVIRNRTIAECPSPRI